MSDMQKLQVEFLKSLLHVHEVKTTEKGNIFQVKINRHYHFVYCEPETFTYSVEIFNHNLSLNSVADMSKLTRVQD